MSHAQKLLHHQPPSAGLTPYARHFAGNAYILTSVGNLGGTTYGTIAALVRRSADGGWDGMGGVRTSGSLAGGNVINLEITDSNETGWSVDSGGTASGAWGPYAADGWIWTVAAKGSGSGSVDYFKCPIGGSWTDRTNWGFIGEATRSTGGGIIGAWEGDDMFDGDIAILAIWKNTALTSTQAHTLSTNYAALAALSPTASWTLTQSSVSTPVTDDTGGGADQTAIFNTSVITDGPALSGYGA